MEGCQSAIFVYMISSTLVGFSLRTISYRVRSTLSPNRANKCLPALCVYGNGEAHLAARKSPRQPRNPRPNPTIDKAMPGSILPLSLSPSNLELLLYIYRLRLPTCTSPHMSRRHTRPIRAYMAINYPAVAAWAPLQNTTCCPSSPALLHHKNQSYFRSP